MSRCDNIKFVSIQFLLFGGGSIFPPPIASVDYPPPLIPHPVCLSQPQSLCLGRGVAFRTIGEGSVRSPPPGGEPGGSLSESPTGTSAVPKKMAARRVAGQGTVFHVLDNHSIRCGGLRPIYRPRYPGEWGKVKGGGRASGPHRRVEGGRGIFGKSIWSEGPFFLPSSLLRACVHAPM